MIKNMLAVIGTGVVIYALVKINGWIVAIRVDEELKRRGYD